MANELDDAIANAAEEILKDIPEDKRPAIETPADGTDETPESDDEPANGAELDDAQLSEAKQLYKLLLDPQQRINVVAALAAQAGILGNNTPVPETTKEVARAKKDIVAIFKEALPEFPALAEKLGPAIDAVLEQEREEHQEELGKIQLIQLENNVNREIEILRRETKGELNQMVEARMADLSSQYLMGPNTSLKDYVRSLYTLATAGRTQNKTSAQIADKIRRNANNAPDRLKTAPGSDTGKVPDKKMSLKESVDWAISQASQGRR